MLSFLLARETMHQNQWLAAIAELEEEGLETTPVPSSFPKHFERTGVAYQFNNFSEGVDSSQGRWASGPSFDGHGEFEFVESPQAWGPEPMLTPIDPRVHGTAKEPLKTSSSQSRSEDGNRD